MTDQCVIYSLLTSICSAYFVLLALCTLPSHLCSCRVVRFAGTKIQWSNSGCFSDAIMPGYTNVCVLYQNCSLVLSSVFHLSRFHSLYYSVLCLIFCQFDMWPSPSVISDWAFLCAVDMVLVLAWCCLLSHRFVLMIWQLCLHCLSWQFVLFVVDFIIRLCS